MPLNFDTRETSKKERLKKEREERLAKPRPPWTERLNTNHFQAM